MKKLKASQRSVTWNAASIPALLLLGAACGTAFASTDIQAPCPEATAQSDALHAILERDERESAIIRTVEGKDAVSQPPLAGTTPNDDSKDSADSGESRVSETPMPELTTRWPGVSANDMPRFRRHMFRTDI